MRGEWFGGLAESMNGSAPVHGQREWLGAFRSIDSARTALSEMSSAMPGHYVIFDQTTGEEVFAESNLKDSLRFLKQGGGRR